MIKICKRFWVVRDRVSSRSGKLCENDHWKNIDSHVSENMFSTVSSDVKIAMLLRKITIIQLGK